MAGHEPALQSAGVNCGFLLALPKRYTEHTQLGYRQLASGFREPYLVKAWRAALYKPGRFVFSSVGDLTRRSAASNGELFASLLGSVAEGLFSTFFPSHCRFCRAPLTKISRVPVCEVCLASVAPLDETVCSICGQRPVASSGTDDASCPECLRHQPPYTRAVAYGHYDGALRDLIHLLKYQRVRPVAEVLGRRLGETIRYLAPQFGPEPPLVVVVPLHTSKFRQRGFNQSDLIARAAVAGILPRLQVSSAVLVRRRATVSQTGLSRPQRRLNVRGAFAVAHPGQIVRRDILLVDDVFTTGTTVSECARIMRRAGCGRVWVATVATVLASHEADSVSSESRSDAIAAARASAVGV